MKEYDFTSHGRTKPYYYIHLKGDEPIGKTESRFCCFDTAHEAAALYQYLQAELPREDFTLGVHMNYTRRASIIEHVGGASILSDEYRNTSPWRDSAAVVAASKDLSDRLGAAWKIDHELTGKLILIPNRQARAVDELLLAGRNLCPEMSGDPMTAVSEASVLGLGWMSIEALRTLAGSCNQGLNSRVPKVDALMVTCEFEGGRYKNTSSINMTPADYKVLEQRYLVQQKEREDCESAYSLDDLKQEAKARNSTKSFAHHDLSASKRPERSR